jgi:hypothetical protein
MADDDEVVGDDKAVDDNEMTDDENKACFWPNTFGHKTVSQL